MLTQLSLLLLQLFCSLFGSLIGTFGSLFISCFGFIASWFFSRISYFSNICRDNKFFQANILFMLSNPPSAVEKVYLVYSTFINQLLLVIVIIITIISILHIILYLKTHHIDVHKARGVVLINYISLGLLSTTILSFSISDSLKDSFITQNLSEADFSLLAFLFSLSIVFILLVPLHQLLQKAAKNYT